LANATIATDYSVFHGGLAIRKGKVWKVLEGDETVPADETIDLAGKLLMPGLIDAHVHFNEPGHEDWEGVTAGSCAAAAGGITTALEMPFNATPVTDNVALLRAKREAVKDRYIIDYGHWGLVENSNIDELEAMHAEGVVAFKGFMCDPVEFDMVDAYGLYRGMELTARWDNVIGVHAEENSLLNGLAERLQAAGRNDRRAWGESRPPVAELIAIEQAVLVAEKTDARLHVCHTSIPAGFEAIQRGKARGVQVTGETCPHYLAFDEDDLVRLGPVLKCMPPPRSRERVERLWQDVLRGRVDVIASDHSPCLPEMKQAGMDNIWKAWSGITGVQTLLPLMLTEGVHRRGLSLSSLVRMTSLNPARIFGLYPAKGHLWPGADADLVVIDPSRAWTLSPDMLFSRHKVSPFEGMTFKGAVVRTYVRGQPVYSDGEILAQPGYGQLSKRRVSQAVVLTSA
jgi:allantoinase